MNYFNKIIYFLGIVNFIIIVNYLLWAGWKGAKYYRLFCTSWWKSWVKSYTYVNPIRCAWERVTKGYSEDDLWNFDRYLLETISNGLEEMRNSPLAPNLEDHEWEDIIQGFRNYEHIYECVDDDCPFSHKIFQRDFEKAMGLLTKHFTGIWL